jgi:DNA-binding response OmpR family regulator
MPYGQKIKTARKSSSYLIRARTMCAAATLKRGDDFAIIDVFICKLRKKLASASNGKDYIETVWGRGYVLREPLDDEARISA